MKARQSVRFCSVLALLGAMAFASIAEAQQPRSSIDRRQRPNGGFWDSGSSSRSSGAMVSRSNWSGGLASSSVVSRPVSPQSVQYAGTTGRPVIVLPPQNVIRSSQPGTIQQVGTQPTIVAGPSTVTGTRVVSGPSATVVVQQPSQSVPQSGVSVVPSAGQPIHVRR